jgi:hypothetical protein
MRIAPVGLAFHAADDEVRPPLLHSALSLSLLDPSYALRVTAVRRCMRLCDWPFSRRMFTRQPLTRRSFRPKPLRCCFTPPRHRSKRPPLPLPLPLRLPLRLQQALQQPLRRLRLLQVLPLLHLPLSLQSRPPHNLHPPLPQHQTANSRWQIHPPHLLLPPPPPLVLASIL